MPWNGNNATVKCGKGAALRRVSAELFVRALELKHPQAKDEWNGWISTKDAPLVAALGGQDKCGFMYPRSYPQFLLSVRPHPSVPQGEIWLPEISRKNVEVCTDSTVLFSVYDATREQSLSEIIFDVRPRHPVAKDLVVDARALTIDLAKKLRGRIVTRDEIFVFNILTTGQSKGTSENILCVAYVADLNVPFDADVDAKSLTMYDTLRGIVSGSTQIYIRKDPKAMSANKRFILRNVVAPPKREKPRNMMELVTSDEEIVPVKKALMRPCITLASVVLEGHGIHKVDRTVEVPRVKVPMDCCVLDRVLLYLESEFVTTDRRSATKSEKEEEEEKEATRAPPFAVELDEAEELLQAARDLGVVGLEDVCLKKLGEFKSRVRPDGIPWDEITKRNASGEIIICLDGMVFDVTRWMPQHPGGSSIIPKQALNMDAARMFEIYHVGAEPFNFLKQFYIGDVIPEDYKGVPKTKTAPSKAFLAHLASCTKWRIRPRTKEHVSF